MDEFTRRELAELERQWKAELEVLRPVRAMRPSPWWDGYLLMLERAGAALTVVLADGAHDG